MILDVRLVDVVKKHIGKLFYLISLAILGFVCLSIFIFGIGVIATKPLPIQVGMTLTNPLAYFNREVDADLTSGHGLRDSYVMTADAKTVFVYSRRFAFSPSHVIASKSWTFTFDTNGTLVSVDASDLRWPMFGF